MLFRRSTTSGYIPEFHDCPCYNILIPWLFFFFFLQFIFSQMLPIFFNSSIYLSHKTSLVESLLSINSTIGVDQHSFFALFQATQRGRYITFFHVGEVIFHVVK